MSALEVGQAPGGVQQAGWVLPPHLSGRLSVALAVFTLFLALELLQRWSVLRPVRRLTPACDVTPERALGCSQPTHALHN